MPWNGFQGQIPGGSESSKGESEPRAFNFPYGASGNCCMEATLLS
jgi:hypothetical protein